MKMNKILKVSYSQKEKKESEKIVPVLTRGSSINQVFINFWHHLSPEVKVLVFQLCMTFCDPMDSSLPGSSVLGILHTRVLEWVVPFSGESFRPRDRTWVSHIVSRFFTVWATAEAQSLNSSLFFISTKCLWHQLVIFPRINHFPKEYWFPLMYTCI